MIYISSFVSCDPNITKVMKVWKFLLLYGQTGVTKNYFNFIFLNNKNLCHVQRKNENKVFPKFFFLYEFSAYLKLERKRIFIENLKKIKFQP
jgi:hypothetical protein